MPQQGKPKKDERRAKRESKQQDEWITRDP